MFHFLWIRSKGLSRYLMALVCNAHGEEGVIFVGNFRSWPIEIVQGV